LLQRANRVALFGHLSPDMDVIGSMLALAHLLREQGRHAVVCSHDPVPARLAIVPGAADIVSTEAQLRAAHGATAGWDLLIAVDGHGASRFGGLFSTAQRLAPHAATLNIDHHVDLSQFCDVDLVDPRAAATAEIVYYLALELGVTPSPAVATCILAGIYTDTVSFQTSAVTERTFEAAAGAVRWGAPAAELAFALFRAKSVSTARLWACVLGSLHYEEDSGLLWADASQTMLTACGAEEEDLSGISAFLGGVQDARVVILLKEQPDGTVQVSFRSMTVDVSALASGLGGGGHRRAAGCTLPGPLLTARRTVLEAARRAVWSNTANGLDAPHSTLSTAS
jgi:phosphoesterase RecJ-like protein